MQLNKQLALLAFSVGITPLLQAANTDNVGFKYTYYQENDDRMNIKYGSIDVKKDIGADYSLNLNLKYDSISGGTPIWDSISGASSGITSDTASGASNCVDRNGLYTCKDTRSSGAVGDGQKDMSDFVYRNVDIEDTRKAVNFSLTKRTERRDEITFGTAYSKEGDFKSIEGSLSYLYNLDSSRNKSLIIGASYQSNEAKHDEGWKDFYVLNGEIGYTQVFTKNTLASVNLFGIKQSGTLSNPYQRVIRYFDVSLEDEPIFKYYRAKEKRPDERKALGVSGKIVSKVLPKLTLHGGYRLYKDDWGILSHTLSTTAYINITKHITLAPLLRYYTQSKAVFYKKHDASNFTFNENSYASNDERLGSYHTFTYGLGVIGKISKNFSANLHYVHQTQSTDLKINYVSLGINYSF